MKIRRSTEILVVLLMAFLVIGAGQAIAGGPGADIPAYEGPESCDVTVDSMENLNKEVSDDETGEVVCVEEGTYTGTVKIKDRGETLVSVEGPEATLVDADGNKFGIDIDGTGLGDVTVKGFKVKGWKVGGIGQGTLSRDGTTAHFLHNIVEVHEDGPSAHGNSIQVTGDGSEVIGNQVEVTGYDHEVTDWGPTGILGMGNDIEIKNNIVEFVDNGTSKLHQGIAVGGGWLNYDWGVPANNIDVENNTVKGSETGISVEGVADSTDVEYNEVKDTLIGVSAGTIGDGTGNTPTNTEVHFNNLVDNEKGVVNEGEDIVDATRNYWGEFGPPGKGKGLDSKGPEEKVEGEVEFHPWLPKPVGKAEKPGVVNPGPPDKKGPKAKGFSATPNPIKSNQQVTFEVQGSQVNQVRVKVFNAVGAEIYDSNFQNGSTVTWNLVGNSGGKLSNGIYLFTLSAKANGEVQNSEVKRLLVIS